MTKPNEMKHIEKGIEMARKAYFGDGGLNEVRNSA